MSFLPKLSTLILLFAFLNQTYAANIWSISNGNWSDITIWSLSQGGAPCNCQPDLGLDQIYIENNVTLNIDLTGGNQVKGLLEVRNGADLSGARDVIVANSGQLNVSGSMTVNSVEAKNGSNMFVFASGVLTANNSFFNSNNSTNITINGTLNTTSGSFFNGNNSAINGIGTIFFNTGSFTNNGTLNGTVDPVNGTVDLGNTGLSVEFAAFEAFTKGENVVLKWYTTSEIDNDHFQIERSTNNSEFEIIGMVEGAINSSVWRSYEFVDESPIQKATYYRIKQVDLDGNSSQTQSRLVVDHLNDKTDKVSVIAMSNGFILSNLSDNAVDLSVFDITGRVILQKQINRSFEYTNTESSGIYFVSFADTKGKISTQKFLFTK